MEQPLRVLCERCALCVLLWSNPCVFSARGALYAPCVGSEVIDVHSAT